ncbi:calcium-binding protein [Rhizobium sp. SG_E_25_P2]|uniref:calcium-binding protein n=1 Tax=Rhizobium sp. SG_E_25_P2 TaxID=2879942 RepID=UPI0024771441|nr:calcium-binding protein [Rhizobium sp. SG_E_25_P2]
MYYSSTGGLVIVYTDTSGEQHNVLALDSSQTEPREYTTISALSDAAETGADNAPVVVDAADLASDASGETLTVASATVSSTSAESNALVFVTADGALNVIYTGAALDDGASVVVTVDATITNVSGDTVTSTVAVTIIGKETGLSLTTAQVQALTSLSSAELDAIKNAYSAYAVTLVDSGGNVAALTVDQIALLDDMGVTTIELTNGAGSVTIAQLQAFDAASVEMADDYTITIADTAANIAALSEAEIAAFGDLGVATLDASENAVSLSLAQIKALAAAGITIAEGDDLILTGEASAINALTVSDIADLVTAGVTGIVVSDDLDLSFSSEIMSSLLAIDGLTITNSILNSVRITVTGEGVALDDFTVAEIATLAALGVTTLDASDDVVSLTVEQAEALIDNNIAVGGMTSTTHSDQITLLDSADTLAALTTDDITALVALGVTTLESTGETLTLTVEQALKLIDEDMSLTAADVVTLTGGVADLTALTSTQLASLTALGIDEIALTDTAANIETLTADQIEMLVGAGLSSVETSGDLDLTVAQAEALDDGDVAVELSGYGEYSLEETIFLENNSAPSPYTNSSATLVDGSVVSLTGVNSDIYISITSSDGGDVLDDAIVNKYTDSDQVYESVTALSNGTFVVVWASWLQDGSRYGVYFQVFDSVGNPIGAETQVNTDTTSGDQFAVSVIADDEGGFAIIWIDKDNSYANYKTTYSSTEPAISILDTVANIEALTTDDIADLAELGVTVIDARSDEDSAAEVEISVEIGDALRDNGIAFVDEDLVTLTGTYEQIAAIISGSSDYSDIGVDSYLVDDTIEALTALDASSVDSSMSFRANGTAAEIEEIGDDAIAALATLGATLMVSDNNGAVTIDTDLAARLLEAGVSFADDAVVTLESTIDTISSDIAAYDTLGIDIYELTDSVANLYDFILQAYSSVADSASLSLIATGTAADIYSEASSLTLSYIGENVAAGYIIEDSAINMLNFVASSQIMTVTNLGLPVTFSNSEGDTLLISLDFVAEIDDYILTLGEQQFVFDADQTVTVYATVASLSDYSVAQAAALATALNIDAYQVADTAANIGEMSSTAAQLFVNMGVSYIDVTDKASATLDREAVDILAKKAVTFSDADTVYVAMDDLLLSRSDAEDYLEAYAAANIDGVNPSDASYTVTGATILTMLENGLVFAEGDGTLTVTATVDQIVDISDYLSTLSDMNIDVFQVSDTGDNIKAMTIADLNKLDKVGVTSIDVSDGAVTLKAATADYIVALGIVFEDTDTVTVRASALSVEEMTADDIAGYGTSKIDIIDVAESAVTLTASQAVAFASAGLTFSSEDVLTLEDTADNIAALSASELAAIKAAGFDAITVTGGDLSLTVAQDLALVEAGLTVTLDEGATILIVDTNANIATLAVSDIEDAAELGVTIIDATDDAIDFTLEQIQALYLTKISVDDSDEFALVDTATEIEGLSASGIATLSEMGLDAIEPTEDASLTVEQIDLMIELEIDLRYDDGIVITLEDSAANLADVSADALLVYAEIGVSIISSTDDVADFSQAQITAIYSGSIVLSDDFEARLADTATNFLAMTTSDFANAETVGVDTFVLADTGAQLATLSISTIRSLSELGIQTIDVTDGSVTLTTNRAIEFAVDKMVFEDDDTVTISANGSWFESVEVDEIAALGAINVDVIDATNNVVEASAEQLSAMYEAGVSFADNDSVSLTATHANIYDVLDLIAGENPYGVETIEITDDGAVALTVAQWEGLVENGVTFSNATLLIVDSEATIEALDADELADLVAYGVSGIGVSQDSATLTVAFAQAVIAAGLYFYVLKNDIGVSDEADTIAALSATQIADLATAGVSSLSAESAVSISLTLAEALVDNSLNFTTASSVTLLLTADEAEAVTADDLSAFGLIGVDSVTIADTAANIEAMDSASVALNGAVIDLTDDTGTFSLAQVQALIDAGASFASADDIIVSVSVADYAQLSDSDLDELTAHGVDEISFAYARADVEALDSTGIATLGARGLTQIDIAENKATLDASQISALATAGISIASADEVTLFDTAANLASLSVATMTSVGVDQIDVSDTNMTISAATASALASAGIAFADEDEITVEVGTETYVDFDDDDLDALETIGADILALIPESVGDGLKVSLTEIQSLYDRGLTLAGSVVVTLVDDIDSLASYAALDTDTRSALAAAGNVTAISVSDTAANIAGLTATTIAALGGLGVTSIAVSDQDDVTLSASLVSSLSSEGMLVDADITISDSATNVAALAEEDLSENTLLDGAVIDLTDASSVFSLAQAQALIEAGASFASADTVTVSVTLAVYSSLSDAEIAALTAGGVDTVSVSVSQADVEALDAGAIATLTDRGLTELDITENAATLDATQVSALATNGLAIAASDVVTLFDTAANLASVSVSTMTSVGVDKIDVSDTAMTISAATASALATASIVFSSANVVTLSDTAANLSSISVSTMTSVGIDKIDVSGIAMTISAATASALATAGIVFASANLVTLSDTAANLSSISASMMTSVSVDKIDVSDNAMTISATMATALASAGISFANADVVTLSDTAANLASLSVATMTSVGVDKIDVSDNAMTISATTASALASAGISFASADVVTLSDTAANLASLSVTTMTSVGVDKIDVSDIAMTISAATATALASAGIAFASDDEVTVTTAVEFFIDLDDDALDALDALGADVIDLVPESVGDGLDLGLDWAQKLYDRGLSLTGDVVVTLADSVDNLLAYAALDPDMRSSLATAGNISAFRLVDAADAIGGLTAETVATLTGLGVTAIAVTDADGVSLSTAVITALALGAVSVDADITIADSASAVAALADAAPNSNSLIDGAVIDLTDVAGLFTLAQIQALIDAGAQFAVSDDISVSVSLGVYAGLSDMEIAALTTAGVDHIVLSVSQADVEALDADAITTLAARGLSEIDITESKATLNWAQVAAMATNGLSIKATNVVTLADSAANLAGLSAQSLVAVGVDKIDISDNALTISAATASVLASSGIAFASDDDVTLSDTAANLATLAVASMTTIGVDKIDVSDSAMTISVATASALASAGISFTSNDVVTLSDTAANLATLAVASMTTIGVDKIDVSDSAMTISVATAMALASAGIAFTSNDVVTLSDTAANLATLAVASMTTTGVDKIDVSDNAMTISVATASALASAGIAFASEDVVTLSDTAANLATLAVASMTTIGVDKIDVSDNAMTIDVETASALATAGIVFADGNAITVEITQSDLADLDDAWLDALAATGVDELNVSDADTSVVLDLEQAQAIAARGLTLSDASVVLSDSLENMVAFASLDEEEREVLVTSLNISDRKISDVGSALSAMTADMVTVLATADIRTIDVADDAMAALSLDVFSALDAAAVVVNGNTYLADTGSVISALDTADVTVLNAYGASVLDATDDVVTLGLDQLEFLTEAELIFAEQDTVTLQTSLSEAQELSADIIANFEAYGLDVFEIVVDASDIEALSETDIASLGETGVDEIDIQSDQATLTAAQIAAFAAAGVKFADEDVVTEAEGHDAPTAVDDAAKAKEHATVQVDVLTNDTADSDLSLSLVSASVKSGKGSVTVNADGTLSVAYTGPDIDGDKTAEVVVSYVVTDGDETDTADLTVTFTATAEDGDIVNGTNKNDRLEGSSADERFNAKGGADIVKAGGGADKVYGDDGHDTLYGEAGDDRIEGNKGKDILIGGAGDDSLRGGYGNDKLTGGDGEDTFVFNDNVDDSTDVIRDFDARGKAHDLIDLSDYGNGKLTYKAVKAMMSQDGNHVEIDLPGDAEIIVNNVDVDDLTKDMFVL